MAAKLICIVLISGLFHSGHAQSPGADSSRAWVTIQTRQSGLAVFIDGREVGKTPLQNFPVTPGPHEVAVRRNFSASWLEADWSGRATIPGGDTLMLAPKFLVGYSIQSTPAHAQVWVAGRFVGTTPYVLRLLDDASAEVNLILQNYQTSRIEIKPENGEHAQRQLHLTLTPVPSSLFSGGYDGDLQAGRNRHRRWGYIAAGISVAAGIGAMVFKQQADDAYEAYLVTGAPAAREHYYDRAQQYDRYYSVAFGISQVSLVFSVYSFLKSIP